MKKIYNLLFLFGITLWLVQCESPKKTDKDPFLTVREMGKNPKKALELLEYMSKSMNFTHEEQRKWELLQFMYKYEDYQSVKKDTYILDVRDYFREKDNLPFYKGYALYYAGIYHAENAKREKALKQWLNLTPYAKATQQPQLLAKIFYNIGRAYYTNNHYTLAKAYYRKSLAVYKKIKDSTKISSCYISFGNNYLLEKNFDSALYYYQQCLDIAQQLKDTSQMAAVLQNMGYAYSTVNNSTQEMKYLKQALPLQKLPERLIRNHITLAKAYYRVQQYDSAGYYLQQIATRIHNIDNPYLLHNYYKTKAKLSIKCGAYEEAITDFNTYTHLYDSITRQITNNQLVEVENDHKQQLLKQELKATRKRQKNYYIIILISGVFILLLLLLLYQLHKKNKTILKSDIQLQQQKAEIERKAQELAQKNQQLAINNKVIETEALKSQFLFGLYKIYATPYIELNTHVRTYEDEMLAKNYDFKKAFESLLKTFHKDRKKTRKMIEKEARHFLGELGFPAQDLLTADNYLYLALIYCKYNRKDVMDLLNTPSVEALAVRKFRVKKIMKNSGMPDHEIDKWLRNVNKEKMGNYEL